MANIWNAIYNIWLCIRAITWVIQYHPIFSILFFSVAIFVTAFFGGAICRCTALEFSRQEKPGILEAIEFSRENFKSFIAAPLLPVVIVMLFGSVIVLIGFLGNIRWFGEILIGLMFSVLLIISLMMALMIFASAAGATLLFPAVAYEKTTGLDALGRSFHYVLRQSLWMIYYTLVEIVLGTLFYLFVRLIIFWVLRLTYSLLRIGLLSTTEGIEKLDRIWSKPSFFYILNPADDPSNWSESVAAFLITVNMYFLVALVTSMLFSFIFSATTIIYCLMRKHIDQIGYDQVSIHIEIFEEGAKK